LFRPGLGLKRNLTTVALVMGLVLTTTLSQLTSTALLSDLKSGLVTGNFDTTEVPYRLAQDYDAVTDTERTASTQQFSVGSRKPAFFPTFAEYSEHPSSADDFVDTGLTLRALFPLAAESSRSLVRNYTGPATVFDSRVA